MNSIDYSRAEPVWAKKRKNIECDFCSESFWKKECSIKRNINHFCSKECAGLFRRKKTVV